MLWRPSGVCAVVLMSGVLRGARGHVPCHAWQCSPCHRGGRPVGCKDQVQEQVLECGTCACIKSNDRAAWECQVQLLV